MKNKQRPDRANPSIIVDRASFLAWVNGDLLIRDAQARCIVGDNVDHERAEKLLREGYAIALTANGVTVSTIAPEKIRGKLAYVEKPWTKVAEAVAIRPTKR